MIETLNYHVILFFGLFISCIFAGLCMEVGLSFIFSIKNPLGKVFFWIIVIISIPGIMLHELGHYIMCLICGIEVKELALIEIIDNKKGKFVGLGGHVKADADSNVVASLGIVIGPILMNALVMVLLWLCYPFLTHWILQSLFIFLLISCLLGSMPSKPDIKYFGRSFRKNNRDGILTILTIGGSFGIFLLLESIIGILLAGMLTFIPAILGLIYLGKKHHEKIKKKEKIKPNKDESEENDPMQADIFNFLYRKYVEDS